MRARTHLVEELVHFGVLPSALRLEGVCLEAIVVRFARARYCATAPRWAAHGGQAAAECEQKRQTRPNNEIK